MITLGNYDSYSNVEQKINEYETSQSMHDDLERIVQFDLSVTNTLYSIDISLIEIPLTPIYKDFEIIFDYTITREDMSLGESEMRELLNRSIGYLRRVNDAEEMEINLKFYVAEMNSLYRLERLVDTAFATYCMDEDETLTLDQVYLLTGMTHQSIKNAATKREIALGKIEEYPGVIFVEDGSTKATEWIKSRKGYRHKPDAISTDSENTVRVPFAADGTYFSPECRMNKGFQIGKRNGKVAMKQRYILDYWDALKALEDMESPHWRRPSKTTGVPGTVTGRRWGNVEKTTILKLIS
jgi:hypothetical protein